MVEKPSARTTAEAIASRRTGRTIDQIEKEIDQMLTAGHRYKNLEVHLGQGAPIFLGKDTPESSWVKLLPKRGHSFEAVVRQVQSTDVEKLARKFPYLQDMLIDYQLRIVINA